MPPRQQAAIVECQETIVNKIDAQTAAMVEGIQGFKDGIEMLTLSIDIIHDKIDLLQQKIETRLQQSTSTTTVPNMEIDFIDCPNHDIKQQDLKDFIATYGQNKEQFEDDNEVKMVLKNIGKYVRWTANDVAEDIKSKNENNELPSWRNLSTTNKKLLIDSVSHEAEKIGIPVRRCKNDWFIHHLVIECWSNKVKYASKKEKKKKNDR
ncbi:hypothetical protein INT45_010291 [Circinella minor]|uniref:DUF4806 domain-containing protein n=1 Tax=Circinella minor TaxID=1195481 RepID=A0A8H7VJ07_9FUNG|nr:hypothetical protein INT45_005498 [Circinella minor]KAG2217359.1 hypothetical protein INT45_010291 [Circinella minor]